MTHSHPALGSKAMVLGGHLLLARLVAPHDQVQGV